MSDYVSQFTGSEIDSRLSKVSQLETSKQDKLVSGTNIKTVGGTSILGSGDIPIQAGDTNAVKYVSQSLTDSQKAQARTNIGAGTYSKPSGGIPASDLASGVIPDVSGKQDTLVSGTNIKTINNESILGPGNIDVEGGEDGVGFDDVTTQQDGTIVITLTNGDTITIDLNHQHTQYPKYVYCSSQAAYDAIVTKESDTLYLILETS